MNYPASDSVVWRVLLGILIAVLLAATARGQEPPDLKPGLPAPSFRQGWVPVGTFH